MCLIVSGALLLKLGDRIGIVCCYFSVTKSCPTICSPMDCSPLGFPVLHYLLESVQTHIHWVSDAIQPSHPVTSFSTCPQFCPASGSFPVNWLFASGGQSIGASASASADWLDLLAVQRTLKSLLQHHSSKASVLWHSAFFMVQPSHPYIHDYMKNHSLD